MKYAILFFSAFVGIVLQDTVFNVISIAEGKPDFVLILVVFYALFHGPVQGGILGVVFGLMEDLMTGRFIGLNAICKGLTGFVIGILSERLYKNNFTIPVLTVFLSTFLQSVIYLLCGALIGLNLEGARLMMVSISDAVYNIVFSPVFYAAFYHFYTSNAEE
ncbi:MAG: rod shape-determining protein MreD [Peptococcaceae bacterium]|nr:rod shape-determining protein MreD [Peptococcaceae bacterium]